MKKWVQIFQKTLWFGKSDWLQMNHIQTFRSSGAVLNLDPNLVELEPKTIHKFHLVVLRHGKKLLRL